MIYSMAMSGYACKKRAPSEYKHIKEGQFGRMGTNTQWTNSVAFTSCNCPNPESWGPLRDQRTALSPRITGFTGMGSDGTEPAPEGVTGPAESIPWGLNIDGNDDACRQYAGGFGWG